MARRAIRALLFDFDGTLVHTDHLHHEAWGIYLKKLGLMQSVSAAFYKANISGRHNPDIFKELLPHVRNSHEVDEHCRAKEELFRSLANEKLEPMPGILRLLNWAQKKHIPHVLVTNAPRDNVEFMLKVCGLTKYFPPERQVLGEECDNAKPHPECYLRGLELCGADANNALAFEDSRTGVAAAVAAGIETFGVQTTLSREELLALGASDTISSYLDSNLLSRLDVSEDDLPNEN